MVSGDGWYYAQGQDPVGPIRLEELLATLPKVGGQKTLVFGPGLAQWMEARHVAAIASRLGAGRPPQMPVIPPGDRADEVDYEIFGDDMQYVVVTLDPGETVVAEAGAMMYMSPGIKMDTQFGDPSAKEQGFLGKLMSAGSRVLTGESLFMTTFRCEAAGREQIAFAAPYPGKIVPLHLEQMGGQMLCQKDSFVAAAKGIRLGIAFQKKIGAGLFGGEGFILQRLEGHGVAFVHAGGTLREMELPAGQTLRVDTGCIVAFQPSVEYDIKFVGGIKNTLFGGEGLYFATLTGPGKVWLQSLPFSRLADRIVASAPKLGGKRRGEGSLLGGLGGLLDGDND